MAGRANETNETKSILLIGLRGAGKTTIGRELAVKLGRTFIDLDDWTLRALNCATVAQAWNQFGESAFRSAEFGALKRAFESPGTVIAAGGGTPTAPGAAQLIRDQRDASFAFIVYLRCTPESLKSRLRGTSFENRPALTSSDPIAEIEHVFAQRDPMYRQLADLEIQDSPTIGDAVLQIMRAVTS